MIGVGWIWFELVLDLDLDWVRGSDVEAGSGAWEDGQADRAWFWPEP